MKMVNEATFNEPEDAEPLRKRLEAAGIHTDIQDERNLQRYWFISDPLAGVHLRVERGHLEKADALLHQWDSAEGVLKSAVHCPACDSPRVDFPQFTRKFVSPAFYAVLCALHLFERKFYCNDCHYTWPASQKLEPKTDRLGWPIREKAPAPVARPPARR
jgi:hypothetical protein